MIVLRARYLLDKDGKVVEQEIPKVETVEDKEAKRREEERLERAKRSVNEGGYL